MWKEGKNPHWTLCRTNRPLNFIIGGKSLSAMLFHRRSPVYIHGWQYGRLFFLPTPMVFLDMRYRGAWAFGSVPFEIEEDPFPRKWERRKRSHKGSGIGCVGDGCLSLEWSMRSGIGWVLCLLGLEKRGSLECEFRFFKWVLDLLRKITKVE